MDGMSKGCMCILSNAMKPPLIDFDAFTPYNKQTLSCGDTSNVVYLVDK